MYQLIRANLLVASCLLIAVKTMATGQEEKLKLIEASHPQLPVASDTNSKCASEGCSYNDDDDKVITLKPNDHDRLEAAIDQQTDGPIKMASWTARQLSDPSNMPVDFLSMLQRNLIEGKNSVEAHVDEHFGVSMPTRVIENNNNNSNKDPNKSKIGNFDENRKLSASKRANKALQAKVEGLQARMSVVRIVFEIIQSLMEFVLGGGGGNAGGRTMVSQSEELGELLEATKNL